ncbi:MAG: HlyD family efflux transporter periplasmic adaptor subunit [Bacteroidota bacterium]
MYKIKYLIPLILAFIGFSCGRTTEDVYTVMKGSFRQSITETGELEAVSADAMTMPRLGWQYGYEYKIIGLAEHGSMVKKGDTVVRIDPSSVEKFIIEKEESLESENAAAKKQSVQMQNNVQELQAQLKSEQASYDLKKLELERVKYESENKRKIKEFEFQQATIRLNKVKRQLKMKPVLDNYDLIVQNIKVQQRTTELASARATLNRMLITSPREGLFQVARNPYLATQQEFKVGDEIYQGRLIARIPDIAHMKVRTFVNEADYTKVHPGMKVIVRLDALPNVPFHGEISSLARVCLPREKEKVFNIVVTIKESDLRLKPGMTVSCEYICHETGDDLYVPNNCLLRENGHSYVFLKKGKTPRKTEVKSGPSNSSHTLIFTNLKPGQRLVPFEEILNEKKS